MEDIRLSVQSSRLALGIDEPHGCSGSFPWWQGQCRLDTQFFSFCPRRDLSMNNLTELWPGLFQHLRFLEEL